MCACCVPDELSTTSRSTKRRALMLMPGDVSKGENRTPSWPVELPRDAVAEECRPSWSRARDVRGGHRGSP